MKKKKIKSIKTNTNQMKDQDQRAGEKTKMQVITYYKVVITKKLETPPVH